MRCRFPMSTCGFHSFAGQKARFFGKVLAPVHSKSREEGVNNGHRRTAILRSRAHKSLQSGRCPGIGPSPVELGARRPTVPNLGRRFELTGELEKRLPLFRVQLAKPEDELGQFVVRCIEIGNRYTKLLRESICE